MTRLACAYARNRGLNLLPLLHRIGLTVHEIRDESIPIAVTTQIRCLNELAAALNDKLLGFHVAYELNLRATGFIYYVAASSATLGQALLRIARYSAIVNEGIALNVLTGTAVRIRFDYAGVSRQADRHQIEAWMTAIIRFCRDMTGRALVPSSVKIMHQRIPESGEFDAFLGRAAQFGAAVDEVDLAADDARQPIVSSDPYLNRLLIKYCDEVVARRKAASNKLRADVENAIAALLPHGQAGVQQVAQKLGISPRTLRRRLAAESTSFARILKELRFALARRYLAEQNLPISRIAWLLGYGEVSTFSHAFRRWSGRAPRAARSSR